MDGSKATTKKIQLGKVSNFYNKLSVAEFKLESAGIKEGDQLAFTGPTTGYEEIIVADIHTDNGIVKEAEKGEIVSIKLKFKVRENDKVYLILKKE